MMCVKPHDVAIRSAHFFERYREHQYLLQQSP